MALVTRFILIVSLLMSSVPGLAVVRCASVAGGECQADASRSPADEACSFCCADKNLASGDDQTGACCCGRAEPEKPVAPASDPKNERLQPLLALVPILIGVLPSEPFGTVACVDRSGPSAHRPSTSIQSLLCVWVI